MYKPYYKLSHSIEDGVQGSNLDNDTVIGVVKTKVQAQLLAKAIATQMGMTVAKYQKVHSKHTLTWTAVIHKQGETQVHRFVISRLKT